VQVGEKAEEETRRGETRMKHKVILLGEPGAGKSTCGLSYPGVEQHCWGSSEDDTALGFKGRKDILVPVKFDWRDCLKDTEKKLFESPDEKKDILLRHKELLPVKNKAIARNVARYIDYLEKLSIELKAGKHPEIKTIFLDNLTPFSENLWTYTEVLHADEYGEKQAFKLHGDFQNYMSHVLDLLISMPVHTVVSCHVQMVLDEETAAKTNFLQQAQVATRKEWQPYVMGRYKFRLAGKFTFAFYLFTETNPGQPTKYLAKLEADSQNVGVGKSRITVFDNPRKIQLPKGTFYQFLEEALNANKSAK